MVDIVGWTCIFETFRASGVISAVNSSARSYTLRTLYILCLNIEPFIHHDLCSGRLRYSYNRGYSRLRTVR